MKKAMRVLAAGAALLGMRGIVRQLRYSDEIEQQEFVGLDATVDSKEILDDISSVGRLHGLVGCASGNMPVYNIPAALNFHNADITREDSLTGMAVNQHLRFKEQIRLIGQVGSGSLELSPTMYEGRIVSKHGPQFSSYANIEDRLDEIAEYMRIAQEQGRNVTMVLKLDDPDGNRHDYAEQMVKLLKDKLGNYIFNENDILSKSRPCLQDVPEELLTKTGIPNTLKDLYAITRANIMITRDDLISTGKPLFVVSNSICSDDAISMRLSVDLSNRGVAEVGQCRERDYLTRQKLIGNRAKFIPPAMLQSKVFDDQKPRGYGHGDMFALAVEDCSMPKFLSDKFSSGCWNGRRIYNAILSGYAVALDHVDGVDDLRLKAVADASSEVLENSVLYPFSEVSKDSSFTYEELLLMKRMLAERLRFATKDLDLCNENDDGTSYIFKNNIGGRIANAEEVLSFVEMLDDAMEVAKMARQDNFTDQVLSRRGGVPISR